MRMGTPQPRQLCKWKLFHLENELYCVQSGVFPTKFGHKLLLSLSAQFDNVLKSWKKELLGRFSLCITLSSDQITFLITMLIF